MKANELRVGNYVLLNGKVTKTSPVMIVEEYQSGLCNTDYLEPIPLSEECLLKFGFENWGIDKFMYINYVLHNVIDGTSNFVITALDGKWHPQIDDSCVCWSDFKYVHQLQNLIFAITGEELTIK